MRIALALLFGDVEYSHLFLFSREEWERNSRSSHASVWLRQAEEHRLIEVAEETLQGSIALSVTSNT